MTARLCARPDIPDPSPNYARLCMPYVGAKVLLNGFIDLKHYRGTELKDPATHELAKRIKMVSDGRDDPNALLPVSVQLETKDGLRKTWTCEQMLASPSRRLTAEQHLTKFRRCWEFAAQSIPIEAQERTIRAVEQLEDIPDVRTLSLILRSGVSSESKSKL